MNKRPASRLAPEVFEEAKPRIIEVLKKCPAFECEDDDTLEAAFKCVSKCFCMDGYQLAKRLDDDMSIEPTALDVEELDAIGSFTYNAFETIQKRWVTENNVVVTQKVGDVVSFKHGGVEAMTGKVINIIPATAKLIVDVQGRRGNPIINFEDATVQA